MDGGDQNKINDLDWILETLIRVATPLANEKLPPHQWTNEKSAKSSNQWEGTKMVANQK